MKYEEYKKKKEKFNENLDAMIECLDISKKDIVDESANYGIAQLFGREKDGKLNVIKHNNQIAIDCNMARTDVYRVILSIMKTIEPDFKKTLIKLLAANFFEQSIDCTKEVKISQEHYDVLEKLSKMSPEELDEIKNIVGEKDEA